MKRTLVVLTAVAAIGVALAWSQTQAPKPDLDFALEKQNPVTHLRLNNDPAQFQFAVVSDRTGGHRAKVFSRAVEQINLMRPEFVVSVGDLIEGYTADKGRIAKEWKEFQTFVGKLDAPFFYVAGNHDVANKTMLAAWKEKFGRTYYHFVYRGVLFLMLDSEDPPNTNPGSFSKDQLAWLKKTLDDNKAARWTLAFLHKPMWQYPKPDPSWDEVEKLLAGRRHTVFSGHVHNYQKAVRNGGNDYYSLATTGGVSMMRGVERGEFDHFVWVTMKKDGPVLANVMLDGVLKEDLTPIGSDEEGVKEFYRRPTHRVEAKVTLDGKPAAGAFVAMRGTGKEPRQPYADGFVEADGTLRLSSYEAYDGAPAGEYAVTAVLRRPEFTVEGRPGPNLLPARYADAKQSGLTMTVAAGANKVELKLSSK